MNASSEDHIRVATTGCFPDTRVTADLGVVLGIAIRSRGVSGNIMAGLEILGNGSALDDYREDLSAARQEAIARMARSAQESGANAVVGMRFDTAEIGREMVEVVAYGTAVIVQDLTPEAPGSGEPDFSPQ